MKASPRCSLSGGRVIWQAEGTRWGALCTAELTRQFCAADLVCTHIICTHMCANWAPRYIYTYEGTQRCIALVCTTRIIAGVCHGYECPVESCNAASIHLRARKLRPLSALGSSSLALLAALPTEASAIQGRIFKFSFPSWLKLKNRDLLAAVNFIVNKNLNSIPGWWYKPRTSNSRVQLISNP